MLRDLLRRQKVSNEFESMCKVKLLNQINRFAVLTFLVFAGYWQEVFPAQNGSWQFDQLHLSQETVDAN